MQNKFKQDSQDYFFRTNQEGNPLFIIADCIDLRIILDTKVPLFDDIQLKSSFNKANSEILEVILDRPFSPIVQIPKIIKPVENIIPLHYREGVLPVFAKVVRTGERTITGLYMNNTAGIQGDITKDYPYIYTERMDDSFCIAYLTESNVPTSISLLELLFKQTFKDMKKNSFFEQLKRNIPFKFYDHNTLIGHEAETTERKHIDSVLAKLIAQKKTFVVQYSDAYFFSVTKETTHLLLPVDYKTRVIEIQKEIELNYRNFKDWNPQLKISRN
ncbi:MAG: hypothetical protein V1663_04340 [archaeon]